MSGVGKRLSDSGYVPDLPIENSPLFDMPPRPLWLVSYISTKLIYPWTGLIVGFSVVVWLRFTPELWRASDFEFGWMFEIYLRNLIVIVVFVGTMHLILYQLRTQDQRFKYRNRWLSTTNRSFLWRNQTRDNVFWSVASGVLIWSAYEILILWAYANDYIPRVEWRERPGYLVGLTVFVIFWHSVHFYGVHRLLHWRPMYASMHYLHHKNVNTGPWSGLAMHPGEHVLYFSGVLLFWVVPAHPFVPLMMLTYMAVGPAPGHSGFDRVVLRGQRSVPAGDYFHNLHHRFFDCNYGDLWVPLDRLLGTFHDGTKRGHELMKARRKQEIAK